MRFGVFRAWLGAFPMVFTSCLLSSSTVGAEEYVPPLPLSSVDTLFNPQQNNGYGLGALIASQLAEGRENQDVVPETSAHRHAQAVSAVTVAARQSQAARKQVAALQDTVEALSAELATRAAQQQATIEKLEQLQASMREQENVPSQAQALTEANNKLNEKDSQLNLQQRQLDALHTQLALVGDSQKALNERTVSLISLQEKMTSTQRELDASRDELATARATAAEWQAEVTKNIFELTTPEAKQDYVVGQSIASGLRERLQSYGAVGLTVSREGVLAGIHDGLTGKMQLKKNEMDTLYRQFATVLQRQVNQRMEEGEKQIVKQGQGRKPAKSVGGITYFVMKKGKDITDPAAPVRLSLKESVMDGLTISNIPRLILTETDEMPTVIREALPLLGEGSYIQAYALARSVYGERPLPNGVEAFTVLSYDLKGLPTAENRK
ncbi:FKBP-type peptidyl-prolyl cis-trans isomerase N-terminal domain-containing protein [Cedecea neteri]|uniref:FKBP-type peptidyl-prolyl cis-trans isomerase N-terminal domain-containing protein n=1 Tax=Cedecea neteri TaxID=158822 RepID=UPI002AA6A9CB|nr:FKBP-type peptidyl-prolyl cis-trans isomerase N-terminal domain-containing protein [Cedecea neteri]WPU21977.1 FKBP-type peptidyl-prolyl cis-trans isomerase N-terminal domain-containing protein [Cedecea neteri]